MHRFFSQSKNISGSKIILNDKTQIHHIRDVLWLKAKDKIAVFDEHGDEYQGEIENFTPSALTLKIIKKLPAKNNREKIFLTVACAIPKKAKIDEIIDKLTQLGADKIIPMETERVVVKLDKIKKEQRLKRWQKIGLGAAQQSQRNLKPEISGVAEIGSVLEEAKDYDLKLIPTLEGSRISLRRALERKKPQSIFVLIGPEGDFSAREIALAVKSGFLPVSLGALTLRVDTAAIAAVSFIKLYENE